MQRDSAQCLKIVKNSAVAVCGLMLAGIAALMFLARGTGEDITGIVAPALLIAFVSGVTAVVAFVYQRRVVKALDGVRDGDGQPVG